MTATKDAFRRCMRPPSGSNDPSGFYPPRPALPDVPAPGPIRPSARPSGGRQPNRETNRFDCGYGKTSGTWPARCCVLHPRPERNRQQVAVLREEGLAGLVVEPEERQELLREDVVLPHEEPRLSRHLLLVVARLRHFAEAAVGEHGQLVVVVEDDPAVARHAEVLEEHVAREDVASGEVADRLAVVDDRDTRLLLARLAQVQVEGPQPALRVEVVEDHLVPAHLGALRRLPPEILEYGRSETRAVELEVLELARVHEPAGAVVAEDEVVLAHDLAAGRGLRRRELVPDQLEDEVVRGQGEDEHHHALLPGRCLEPVVRPLHVVEERAVELGLPVARVPDRVVQLADGLARHEAAQERDHLARAVGLDEEVRPREAEDDRCLVLGEQHRVDARPGRPRSRGRSRSGATPRKPAARGPRGRRPCRGRRGPAPTRSRTPGSGRPSSRSTATRDASRARSSYPHANAWWSRRRATRPAVSWRRGQTLTTRSKLSGNGSAASAWTNSIAGSTPVVAKTRRVTELKNVSASSGSGSDARCRP